MALCKKRRACYNVPYDRAKEGKAAMDYQTTAGSRDVARAAIELSMTQSRDEEQRWRQDPAPAGGYRRRCGFLAAIF